MTKFLNERVAEIPQIEGMGRVAAFWHRVARESFVSHADAATLEVFEGLTSAQLNDALYRFDSDGNEIAARAAA